MENKELKAQTLDEFNWDDFGVKDPFDEGLPLESQAEEEQEKDVEEQTSVETIDFDEESWGVPEEEVETEVKEKEQQNNNTFSKLKESGLFSTLELEENKEYTEDDIPELFNEELENRVDEVIESFMEELDEDGAAFLKFKKQGGSTKDFLDAYSKINSRPTGNLEDVKFQEKIVQHYLSTVEDFDDDEISDRIEWLKENGKLSNHATKYNSKLEAQDKLDKENLLKAQELSKKQMLEQRQKLTNEIKENLEAIEEYGHFKFSKKEKSELYKYITQPSIKNGKNSYSTKLQHDLALAFKDKQKMLVLAKILYNDFDVSDVVRDTKTKVTKETEKMVNRKSEKPIKSSRSSIKRERAVHDYFE